MPYLRFTVPVRHLDTGVADGVFRTAYELRDSNMLSRKDREVLAEQLAWFNKNLAIPKRLNRSSSKGYYRRNTKGIAWLRDDALQYISRMFEMRCVLEANGHLVPMSRRCAPRYY